MIIVKVANEIINEILIICAIKAYNERLRIKRKIMDQNNLSKWLEKQIKMEFLSILSDITYIHIFSLRDILWPQIKLTSEIIYLAKYVTFLQKISDLLHFNCFQDYNEGKAR